jgi:hypothetical protein
MRKVTQRHGGIKGFDENDSDSEQGWTIKSVPDDCDVAGTFWKFFFEDKRAMPEGRRSNLNCPLRRKNEWGPIRTQKLLRTFIVDHRMVNICIRSVSPVRHSPHDK